jgi:hypothetical protein
MEDHLDELAKLARSRGLTPLLTALRQRYPGQVS